MKKVILYFIVLSMVFTLHSKQIQPLSELIYPSILDCDSESLFVLDGVVVYVYSKKNYQLKTKFGKRGEGPGELITRLDLPASMHVYKDQVILNSFNKLIFYTKEGKFIKEKKIPFLVSQIIPLGENYVVTKFTRRRDGSSLVSVLLMDENWKPISEVYKNELLNDQGRGKIALPLLNIIIRVNRKNLYIVDQQKDFQIEVYDHQAKKLSEIKKEYNKIRITDTYKKEKLAWIKLQPAFKNAPVEIMNMIYFLDYLPVIEYFLVKNDHIYVQTSKTQDTKAEFYILDLSGKIIKKVFLPNARQESIRLSPAAAYTFNSNLYYYLQENEDEEWELHIQDID